MYALPPLGHHRCEDSGQVNIRSRDAAVGKPPQPHRARAQSDSPLRNEMPGLVAFRRRWSIGSDDLTGPTVTLCLLHIIWVLVLIAVLCTAEVQPPCSIEMRDYGAGTAVIMSACAIIEAFMAYVSAKGSVLDTAARGSMPYIIYTRGALLLVEFGWMVVGIHWLVLHADDCSRQASWRLLAGAVATNFSCIFFIIATLVAVFDASGAAFAKAKSTHKAAIMDAHEQPLMSWIASARSRAADRHFKQLQHKKWEKRVGTIFCCRSSTVKDDEHNVFQEVAVLLSTFFEDLDLVLSDVVCGLTLLRMYQKHREQCIINAASNDVYQYLSGVPVSPRTRFLSLSDEKVMAEYKQLAHFAKYAEACYGWQGYCLTHCCTACCHIGMSCMFTASRHQLLLNQHQSKFTGDNCCMCNYIAILKTADISAANVVYGSYQSDVSLPSFFVALDHDYRKVVVCIRGTLSMSDVLTDLLADAEEIKVEPQKPTWLGHKGMLNAAINIKKKLVEEGILAKAFEQCPKDCSYSLLVVGHSLGAGTAAILTILLHQDSNDVHCYAFSPPGGLLSHDAAKETRNLITSVVLGKDVVCRLGLSQMEHFRADILRMLKMCQMPKWKILCSIGKQNVCCSNCCCCLTTVDVKKMSDAASAADRDCRFNPFSSKLLLSCHVPMFLPGRIVHIVRNYPKPGGKSDPRDPVYQAIWADAAAFDEIVVSPRMFTDHMPSRVVQALQKVLQSCGPRKPEKLLSTSQRQVLLLGNECGDLQDLLQRHGGVHDGFAEQDAHSLESGLSWEYTCQSEASVALRTPMGQKSLPEAESVNVAVAAEVGAVTGASSTTSRNSILHVIPLAQVHAPVASIEDLRSVAPVGSGTLSKQSTPSDTKSSTAAFPPTMGREPEAGQPTGSDEQPASPATSPTNATLPSATPPPELQSTAADIAAECPANAHVRRLLASPSGEHYVLAFDYGGCSALGANDADNACCSDTVSVASDAAICWEPADDEGSGAQHEYSLFNDHYSRAGRGYPHGMRATLEHR